MKTLEMYALEELTSVELEQINGGAAPHPTMYIKQYFSEMWSDFVDGFNDGSGANC